MQPYTEEDLRLDAARLIAKAIDAGLTIQITHANLLPPAMGGVKHQIHTAHQRQSYDKRNEGVEIQCAIVGIQNAQLQLSRVIP